MVEHHIRCLNKIIFYIFEIEGNDIKSNKFVKVLYSKFTVSIAVGNYVISRENKIAINEMVTI